MQYEKSMNPGIGDETGTPAIRATDTHVLSLKADLKPSSTATNEPTIIVTPEPSQTEVPAIRQLEIVEWGEFPYANLANPQNTDTRVEILARNPNNFRFE